MTEIKNLINFPQMTPWPATIKSDTDATGHFVILPNSQYKVGTEVEVDLDTKAVRKFRQGETRVEVECVQVVGTPNLFFPTSMLDL